VSRRPIVAGNWKMNLDHVEAVHLISELGVRLRGQDASGVDVVVLPPFTDLRTASSVIEADRLDLALGAQHVSEHSAGAYTGEISTAMLARLGVTVVVAGHSERRRLFGMDDEAVARTAVAIRDAGLVPMVCVGETGDERDAGETESVLTRQLDAVLGALGDVDADRLLLAYEPVWAIGTGVAATSEDAQAASALLRQRWRAVRADGEDRLRILYGGSVSSDNAAELVEGRDVDGLLVGGASLTAASFAAVVDAVAGCYRSSGPRARR
jgi:triosephosphate isomerase (TIM)